MSADLALQKALRARLVATPAVTGLVPEASILDRNQRPAPSPSIVLGESQMIDEGTSLGRNQWRIFHSVHIWKREDSLEGVKTIAAAVLQALGGERLALAAGFHCGDARVASTRFLRDPDGETAHGVIAIEALVEVAA